SNIGAHHLLGSDGGAIPDDVRDSVLGELRAHFRPEFLNRVDDIVVFSPLGREQIQDIVELQFTDLRSRLAERQIRIELTPAARQLIA
ncbi:hypothetical protein GUG94_20490, partial [Xanthomonas citri pv. citri]|nr:hypothetical protein [Xanthomonas citri pv. citri]